MDIKGLAQVLNLDPLRLLEGQNALNTLLGQTSGADLEAILAGRTTDGLLLQLLHGRTLVAGGDLPFPDGTRLVLRAVPAPDQGALRLQLLQATPPPPSPVLLPLEQGEAAALLARVLGAEEVPALLEPLRILLAQAQAEQPPPPQTSTAPPPFTPPSASPPPSAPVPLPAPGSGAAATSAPLPAKPPQAEPAATPPIAVQDGSSSAASAPATPPSELPLLRAWLTRLRAAPEPSASLPPGPEAEPAAAASSLPSPEGLTQALVDRGLPPQEAKAWATFLLDPKAAPPMESEALLPTPPEASLGGAEPRAQAGAPSLPLRLPRGVLEAGASDPSARTALGALLDELRRAQVPDPVAQRLMPLLALARHASEGGGAIEQLLRALLPQAQAPEASPVRPPERPWAAPPPSGASSAAASAQPPAPGLWDAPETWQSWLKAATQALADPKVSPREAPFHALQAREGTALFELPLPLPGLRGPVELWVERDREREGGGERPTRMLVALEFEGMGQVRLGVQGLGGRIRADLWVEEERRPAVARALAEELGDPPPYPLRVLGFHGSQPGLRQAAGAGAFGAMG